jgi:hypothetical protein
MSPGAWARVRFSLYGLLAMDGIRSFTVKDISSPHRLDEGLSGCSIPKSRYPRVKSHPLPIRRHLEIVKEIFIKIFQDFFLYRELYSLEVH